MSRIPLVLTILLVWLTSGCAVIDSFEEGKARNEHRAPAYLSSAKRTGIWTGGLIFCSFIAYIIGASDRERTPSKLMYKVHFHEGREVGREVDHIIDGQDFRRGTQARGIAYAMLMAVVYVLVSMMIWQNDAAAERYYRNHPDKRPKSAASIERTVARSWDSFLWG